MQDYLHPLTKPILHGVHPSQKIFRTNRNDALTPNLPTLHRLPGYDRHRDNYQWLAEKILNVFPDMLQIQQEGIVSEKRRVFSQFHMSH